MEENKTVVVGRLLLYRGPLYRGYTVIIVNDTFTYSLTLLLVLYNFIILFRSLNKICYIQPYRTRGQKQRILIYVGNKCCENMQISFS